METWKIRIEKLINPEYKNLDDLLNKKESAHGHITGFVHEQSGSGIIADQNGNLEGFADYGIGFRLDRENQTLSLFAPHIQLIANTIKTFNDDQKADSFIKNEHQDILRLLEEI